MNRPGPLDQSCWSLLEVFVNSVHNHRFSSGWWPVVIHNEDIYSITCFLLALLMVVLYPGVKGD